MKTKMLILRLQTISSGAKYFKEKREKHLMKEALK